MPSLALDAVQRAAAPLRALAAEARVEALDEVSSTNDRCSALAAEGAPEGTLVVAARQTKGRGRLGRSWASPDGGLYLSILLRPDEAMLRRLPVTLLAGLAVAEAADRFLAGVKADLKWPNDVHVKGKKLAGVLGEMTKDARGPLLVLGLGVNVGGAASDLPAEVRELATTLAAHGATATREEVLGAVLERFCDHYKAVRRGGGVTILSSASARMPLLGKPVRVRLADRVIDGVAAGLSATGGLVVEERGPDGFVRRDTVLAGEVEEVRPS